MCGIGGILRITLPGEKHEPIPDEWLDLLDEGIAWRGPDGHGRFRDTVTKPDGTIIEVALVHRRLAIIDLEGGHQPMVSEHGRQRPDGTREGLVAVVFNGCIYNHRQLRAELEAKEHEFITDHSDTEVLIHGWREHAKDWWVFAGDAWDSGEWSVAGQAWDTFDGMYAALIWDRDHGALLSLRDRFNEKPLFESELLGGKVKLYASSVAAMENLRVVVCSADELAGSSLATIDADRLHAWIAMGFDEHSTPLASISFVEDGLGTHIYTPPSGTAAKSGILSALVGFVVLAIFIALTIASAIGMHYLVNWLFAFLLSTGLFWVLLKLPLPWLARGLWRRHKKLRRLTSPDELERLVEHAVVSRLDADVPLGCFLSGGIDSSLMACFARRHVDDLTTLTVRMPDARYDESHHAETVARALGTRHVTIDCDAQHAASDLVGLIETLGLPFGDSSLLPTYWLCRAAAEHVKVAISGDGADELFFGYDRYRAANYLGFRRFALKCAPTRWLDRADPKSRSDRIARLIHASRGTGYIDLLAIFPSHDRRQLFDADTQGHFNYRVFGRAAAARDEDLRSYLPGDLLRKVDTASLAAGLEVRCPYLEPTLAAAAREIPRRHHMRHGETKHLLKELARKHLPPEIINRPKQGFAIPLSDWWRTDFGQLGTLMLDHLTSADPFPGLEALNINMDYVRQMIDEHMAAGPAGTAAPIPQLSGNIKHIRPRDHAQRLYMLTVLSIWARWLQGIRNSPQSTQSPQSVE